MTNLGRVSPGVPLVVSIFYYMAQNHVLGIQHCCFGEGRKLLKVNLTCTVFKGVLSVLFRSTFDC